MSVFPGIGRLCPLPFPYQHHSNPSGLPRPRSVSACPPEQSAGGFIPSPAPPLGNPFFPCSDPSPPRRILAETCHFLFNPRFFQQLWQVSPLAEPGGQWRLNQHHSNAGGLPRPQRLSTCSPLNGVPKGCHSLACPATGNPVLSVFPTALFTNSFWQASPPGGTRGLKAAERKPPGTPGRLVSFQTVIPPGWKRTPPERKNSPPGRSFPPGKSCPPGRWKRLPPRRLSP